MNKPTLTLCMIVRNEEKFLRQCLDSAAPYVDEIVVVDTGSTDGTLDILRDFEARQPLSKPPIIVKEFQWINDFAAARNYALTQATSDWILSLDADETLTPENGQRIRNVIAAADNDRGGIECTLEYEQILLNGGRRTHESRICRLFRRNPLFRFEGAVHEDVAPSIWRSKSIVATSGVRIQHHGYAQSLEVMQAKAQRNLDILDTVLTANPHDFTARYHRANSLTYLERFGEAMRELVAILEYGQYLPPALTRPARELYDDLQRHFASVEAYRKSQQPQQHYTDHALVDFTLNYARFKLSQFLRYVPEAEQQQALALFALLDAVTSSDAVSASELLRSRAVVIEPEFFFECVGGTWNESVVPEPPQSSADAGEVVDVSDAVSRLQQKRKAA